MSKHSMLCCAVGVLAMVCLFSTSLSMAQQSDEVPALSREFRGVWVATVANIDWPTKPGLSVAEQKAEAIAILDRVKELNMNAVVFQVRAQTDAFYKSDLEPWSYYLTGQQGKAPDPFYDPLEFWVEEAHARGLELHAWFNPYRANHPALKGELHETSVVKAKPELVVKLGDKGYYWMDPALKGTQDHSAAVVMDVVNRYDVDGIHFDDYFYPYSSYNDNKDFPDEASWQAYKASGGTLSRGDWRRDAVNTFIERIYREIKEAKPHVKFGLSPFGIWRPGNPPGIVGLDQYDSLYADAKLWLNEGWVDYFTPQLYWPINRMGQSYPLLLGWWASENTKDRNLWPGLSIAGVGKEGGVDECLNEIMVTRGMVPNGPGNVFFSMKAFSSNRGGLNDALLEGPYKNPALVPPSPWLDATPPEAPAVTIARQGDWRVINWEGQGSEEAFLWCVYKKQGRSWKVEIIPGSQDKLVIDLKKGDTPIERVAVSAVDRTGNESLRTVVAVE